MKRIAILLPICLMLASPAAPAQDRGNAPDGAANELRTTDITTPASPSDGKRMLRAGVQESDLSGDANSRGDNQVQKDVPMQPESAAPGQSASTAREPVRLSAQQTVDPDKGNREVMLAWDKWRNHFAHSVWERYCQTLDGPGTLFLGSVPIKVGSAPGYQFEPGLVATYTCIVNSDRHITYARITKPSGDPRLDAIILQSVFAMAGKHSVAFPKGSLRQAVMEQESLSTGPTGWHGRSYGDTEHYAASK